MGVRTTYREEYDKKLVISARRGETVCEFCADIGISEATFYVWIGKYPTFKESHKEGLTIRKAVFMSNVRKGAWHPAENPANNGLVYLLGYNLGVDVKPPEKKPTDVSSDLAEAIKEIVGKLPG